MMYKLLRVETFCSCNGEWLNVSVLSSFLHFMYVMFQYGTRSRLCNMRQNIEFISSFKIDILWCFKY